MVWFFEVWTRKVSLGNTVGENKTTLNNRDTCVTQYFQRAFLAVGNRSLRFTNYELRVLVYIRFFFFSFLLFFFSHQILSILYKANPLVYPFHSFRFVSFRSQISFPLPTSTPISLSQQCRKRRLKLNPWGNGSSSTSFELLVNSSVFLFIRPVRFFCYSSLCHFFLFIMTSMGALF